MPRGYGPQGRPQGSSNKANHNAGGKGREVAGKRRSIRLQTQAKMHKRSAHFFKLQLQLIKSPMMLMSTSTHDMMSSVMSLMKAKTRKKVKQKLLKLHRKKQFLMKWALAWKITSGVSWEKHVIIMMHICIHAVRMDWMNMMMRVTNLRKTRKSTREKKR